MPLPFNLNSVPVCVPSGMVYFVVPSNVGISISTPRAASVKLIGTLKCISLPFRLNISWGSTFINTNRSPEGPPLSPPSPSPRTDIIEPVFTPAGIFTLIFFVLSYTSSTMTYFTLVYNYFSSTMTFITGTNSYNSS